MGSPAARSVASHAVRCIRRQLNPVLNSGVLDQQVVASGFCGLGSGAPVVDGVADFKPRGTFTRSQEEVDAVRNARDGAISQLDALIAPIRSVEVGYRTVGWNHAHVMNDLLGSETCAGFAKVSGLAVDDVMLNSAQRELKKQFALIRYGRDLSRFLGDLTEGSREASSLVSVVADCSVEGSKGIDTEQGVRLRKEGVSRLVSRLGYAEGGLGLTALRQENVPFECSSVKRKRKKKMNKHKQRKLRRRDRHRN